MAEQSVRVRADELKRFTKAVFEKSGFTPEGAEHQADVLVWANLRGVDSHGVQRISWYLELVDKGHMKPRPNIRIQKETPSVLLIDADCAGTGGDRHGHAQGHREGTEGRHRLGRDPQHAPPGSDGILSLMAANEGMAGIAIVCNPPNMAPHGARASGVHNSPIAICVPGQKYRPLMLDMATEHLPGLFCVVVSEEGMRCSYTPGDVNEQEHYSDHGTP